MEALNTILNIGLVLLAGASFIWRCFAGKRKAPAVIGLFAILSGTGYWLLGEVVVARTLFYVGVAIWVGLTLFEDVAEWRAKRPGK